MEEVDDLTVGLVNEASSFTGACKAGISLEERIGGRNYPGQR